MRAVVAAAARSQPMIRRALFSVLTDTAHRRHWTSSRSLISVARSALSASVSAKRYRVAPDVVQHEVSVSLGIVGHHMSRTDPADLIQCAVLAHTPTQMRVMAY